MIIKRTLAKKLIAIVCIMLLAVIQAFVIASDVHAETAGADLVVRVQYIGERGDKVREIRTFSRSELSSMSAGTFYYSNITSVGGIMRTKATGPRVTTIISSAGIDLGSVHHVNFRTADGRGTHKRYSGDFSIGELSSEGWYYPNLMKHYKSHSDGTITPLGPEGETEPSTEKPTTTEPTEPTDTPTQPTEQTTTQPTTQKPTEVDGGDSEDPADTGGLFLTVYGAEKSSEGALTGAVRVPAILAVSSYSTKVNSVDITGKAMTNSDSYRLCLGQTTLHENVRTTSADVSSSDSAKYIFGIDVIVNGYAPIEGIELRADGTDVNIGSKTQIHATVKGSDFAGFTEKDLFWETSNKRIATVDENGLVTIKGKGAVTITASSGNGQTASITINGTPSDDSDTGGGEGNTDPTGGGGDSDKDVKDKEASQSKTPDSNKNKKPKDVVVKKVYAKEINIGDEIVPEEQEEQQSSSNVQALSKAEQYSKKTAAGAAAVAISVLGLSGAFRIRKFKIDIK